ADRENQWYLYAKWLTRQMDEPVFDESFSLRQVYIPLRAYYKVSENKKECEPGHAGRERESDVKRIVTLLERELSLWFDSGDKKDAIRLLRGGPGFGKSSFLKMFAEKMAGQGARVIFIPLHRFEVKDDLTEAVRKFLSYDKMITSDPFEEEKLLLIFDGLDEISMQGKALAEVASQFLREVERKVGNYNNLKTKLMVVISGRDVIVQQNESDFRKNKQVLRLLPYYLTDREKKNLSDKEKLLEQDQRDLWWQNYGKLKGMNYKGLPENLKNPELDEITAQPLLNYLVALSFERGRVDFSEETNLNEIYSDLLEAVYDRNYEESGTLKPIKSFPHKDFIRILEEIAVASWHGDGRTTTVNDIENHFEEGGLKKILAKFVKEAEKGVISLLTAFYFRQAGLNVSGAETFEFTHKSFGEYLAAKRIVNKIKQIYKKLSEYEEEPEDGWSVKVCLTQWAKLFGPKELDYDLVKYINNEIKLEFGKSADVVKGWQQTVIKLIN
ncbi:MAG: hypothetical protein GY757_47385, partial [bacterium]|nr:hypothetical protein [bacterium]